MPTKLKRKLPPEAYIDKICKWCKSIIKHKRQSLSAWKLISTCGSSCATNWSHYKCAKDTIPELSIKHCPACNKELIRRNNEKLNAFIKRKTCGKSCAAQGTVRIRVQPVKQEENTEIRLGVKRYVPGSPEFNRIAKLYGYS